MKTPTSLHEFKDLIGSMSHRERFVFPIKKDSKVYKDLMCTHLEVYTTEKGGNIYRPIIQNVLFQTVCIEGKFNKKHNTKRSSYYHLIPDKMWSALYEWI